MNNSVHLLIVCFYLHLKVMGKYSRRTQKTLGIHPNSFGCGADGAFNVEIFISDRPYYSICSPTVTSTCPG